MELSSATRHAIVASAMRIELIHNLDQLVALREDWNRLAGDLPMRSWEWNYTWAETMLGEQDLVVLVGKTADNQTQGIAPLYRKYDWLRGDTLRFLGDARVCTDYTTFLCTPESATSFVESAARWLSQRSAGFSVDDVEQLSTDATQWLGWDILLLQGIEQTDPVMLRFSETMASLACTVRRRANDACWHLELPDCWSQYVQSLSKSQRRNVRLVERRFLTADDVEIHAVHDEASLEFAMGWFRELHQKRWRQDGEPGCFADKSFANFLNKVAERLFARNQLRVLWIEKAGKPIAVDFTFLSNEASYGYQMGIDPDYRNQEIGRALLVAAMQSTHQSGRRRFDFLRGNESYKTRWNAQACPLVTLEVVADRTLPQLRNSFFDLARNTKRSLESWRSKVGR